MVPMLSHIRQSAQEEGRLATEIGSFDGLPEPLMPGIGGSMAPARTRWSDVQECDPSRASVTVPGFAIYAVDPVSSEDDNSQLLSGMQRKSDFALPETRYALT